MNLFRQPAADALIETAELTEPDPELTPCYETQYKKFRQIYPALKELFPKLR